MAATRPRTVPIDIVTTRKQTIVLNIPPSLWQPPTAAVSIGGDMFIPKSELHVTLIGSALFDEIHRQLSLRVRRRLFADARSAQWRIDRAGELRLLEHLDPRQPEVAPVRSIIELIELVGVEDFYRAFEQEIGRQLPRPPSHVTLYTLRDGEGIAVPDAGSLRRLSVRTLAREEIEPA